MDNPRYIDINKLTARLPVLNDGGEYLIAISDVRLAISLAQAETGEVEEVVREIFEAIEREITDALKSNYEVRQQVEESESLWNNVNGKINALCGIEYFIEELKKKYTEGHHVEKN